MKKFAATTLLAALVVLGIHTPVSAATVQVTTQTEGAACTDSEFTPNNVLVADGDTVVFSVGKDSGYTLKLDGFGPAPVTIIPGSSAAFSVIHKTIDFTGTWVKSICPPMSGTIKIGTAGQQASATGVKAAADSSPAPEQKTSQVASKSDSSVIIAAAAAIIGAVLWVGSSLLLKTKK
jgi:hypothetical protein